MAALRTRLALQELLERPKVGATQHLFVMALLLSLNLSMKNGNSFPGSRIGFITPDSILKVIRDTPDAIYWAVKNLGADQSVQHSGRTGKRCSRY